MKSFTALLAVSGLAAVSMAQRPANMSICDHYTTALLGESNATSQAILLTLVVNTAIIGNYTEPNVGVAVPGILKAGKYMGKDVDLLPYFSGALASSNPPGSKITKGVAVNWLDGGGADPLTMNQLGDDGSHQATLMMHLYTYFAPLLGCSAFGTSDTAYEGDPSMYNVHKYMALSNAEVGYFIEQVGLSASSFGVMPDDVTAVGTALTEAFGYKCAPEVAVPEGSKAELQSICIEDDCPLAKGATCDKYEKVMEPQYANGTYHDGEMAGKANATMTGGSGANNATKPTMSAPPPSKSSHAPGNATGGAEIVGANLVLAGVVGVVVAML